MAWGRWAVVPILALYSVLAWRIYYATMLARSVPEAPCSVLLEPAEGKRFLVPSIASLHRLGSHRRWGRRSVGVTVQVAKT